MKSKLFIAALLLSRVILNAQSTQVVDLSTGVVNGGTTLAALGSNDDTWTVKIPGTGTYVNAPVSNSVASSNMSMGGYVFYSTGGTSNPCGNHYISPYTITIPGHQMFGYINYNTSGSPPYDLTPAGIFEYKMNFSKFDYCAVTGVTLNINKIGVDNKIDSITINGHTHNLTSYYINLTSGVLPSFSIPIPANEIIYGINTVKVHVYNNGGPTCMMICGNLTINYSDDPNLVPYFSGPSAFCPSDPISFTWSDGPSICTNYYWEIAECNSGGAITPGGFSWYGWYPVSAPGTYTFPSNIGITCGKYYKVKLAVQNQCVNWREANKVIYLNCAPATNAGPDVTICSNDCFDYTGRLGAFLSYQWTGPSGVISNTSSIHVCPAATTTYTYTITSSLTGCSSSDNVTVNVINNDPSFSLYVNTANPSYFTVQATANNTGAYSVPGFYYAFEIQELDGSLNPYYTNTGTDAWWYFPMNEFRGHVSTGTGTATQTPWSTWPHPGPGTFQYGHTYKIKRTTWNESCPQQSSYVIITPVRSLSTGETTMIAIPEGSEIPADVVLLDATSVDALMTGNNISVYPNPGTGMFTVEMNSASQVNIEVYDALGKKVKELEQNGFKSVIDLTGFPKGMYMVNLISEGKLISKKIVLQ